MYYFIALFSVSSSPLHRPLPILTLAKADRDNVLMQCIKAGPKAELARQADQQFLEKFQSLVPMPEGCEWIVYASVKADAALTEPMIIECVDGKPLHIVAVFSKRSQATMFVRPTGMHACEVFVGEEASIDVVTLLQSGTTSASLSQQSQLQAGGKIHWHNTTIGGSGEKHDLRSTLLGANASSSVDWIFHGAEKQKQHISVRNVFAAPDGSGEITIKGVAEDSSKSSCYGMIEITEEGRGTNTYLTEDVLMLDATAHIDAVPALEIRTNDVKASHSATISRVTSEDLFYLQSRGLTVESAKQMFVDGFLGALTERIADIGIRQTVAEAIREAYERN